MKKSSKIFSQRKNFVNSVRKQYGNSDSHAFSLDFEMHHSKYFIITLISDGYIDKNYEINISSEIS